MGFENVGGGPEWDGCLVEVGCAGWAKRYGAAAYWATLGGNGGNSERDGVTAGTGCVLGRKPSCDQPGGRRSAKKVSAAVSGGWDANVSEGWHASNAGG